MLKTLSASERARTSVQNSCETAGFLNSLFHSIVYNILYKSKTMENITEAEAELYDRQIRLWGLDAQRR